MKKCKDCKQEKPLSEFYKATSVYYSSKCKKCYIKKSGEWAKANPEKNRAKALRYSRKKLV